MWKSAIKSHHDFGVKINSFSVKSTFLLNKLLRRSFHGIFPSNQRFYRISYLRVDFTDFFSRRINVFTKQVTKGFISRNFFRQINVLTPYWTSYLSLKSWFHGFFPPTNKLFTKEVTRESISRKMLSVIAWKLQKFSVTLFLQKFRESNNSNLWIVDLTKFFFSEGEFLVFPQHKVVWKTWNFLSLKKKSSN